MEVTISYFSFLSNAAILLVKNKNQKNPPKQINKQTTPKRTKTKKPKEAKTQTQSQTQANKAPFPPPKPRKPAHLVYMRFILSLDSLGSPCIGEALLRMIWGVLTKSIQ